MVKRNLLLFFGSLIVELIVAEQSVAGLNDTNQKFVADSSGGELSAQPSTSVAPSTGQDSINSLTIVGEKTVGTNTTNEPSDGNPDTSFENNFKSFEEVSRAANQGNVKAQNFLGSMYELGKGVTKDMSKAAEWYHKAADQGDAEAQTGLGFLYYFGDGVVLDMGKAAEWFEKSANQGGETAQFCLGWMYESGEGVVMDKGKAVEWYSKAANKGNADAQFLLGEKYFNGEGISQNKIIAYMWWMKSAVQGNTYAKEGLKILCKENPWICKKTQPENQSRLLYQAELSRDLQPKK
jgi:TPR repeat protein